MHVMECVELIIPSGVSIAIVLNQTVYISTELLYVPFVHLNIKHSLLFFIYRRFSLFLKDPFFPDYLEVATAVIVSVWSW